MPKMLKRKIAYCQLVIMLLCLLCPKIVLAASDEAVPNGFEKIAESERLILYSKVKEGEIAVKDKKEGKIWFSNPQDADKDKIANGAPKVTLSSQVTVKFVDPKNAVFNAQSKLNAVGKGGLTSKKITNGIEFTMDFTKEKLKIPVRYTLEKDYLKAEIVSSQISEYGDNRVISIGLLPFFGAGGLNDNGYLMIPDGSGALINFNNGKKFANEYSENVYGIDYAYDRSIVDTFDQQVAMPVFGIKKNDSGFLAVIAQNESQGIIKASVSGKTTSYNNVFSEFQYRSMGSMSLPQKNFKSEDTPIVERTAASKGSFEVRYYFLTDGKYDYNGMADTYRQYLIDEKNLKQTISYSNIPFYLDVYGFVKKKKPILGIPFERTVTLTDFKDTEGILEKLKADGIGSTVVRYNGWLHDAYLEKIPSSADVESKLGGEKGLKELSNYIEKNNDELYLNVDFLNVYKTGHGFSKFADSAKTVVNAPAVQYMYNINVYNKDYETNPWYLLSPKSLMGFVNKFISSFNKLNIKNLSFDSIGTKVYSDLGIKGFERWKAPGVYEEALNTSKSKVGGVMVDGGNSYAIPYADHIIEPPAYSSKFDMEDEAIPFYQIVLHGMVAYSSPAINLSSNPELEKLRCLETGSNPLYSWIARDTAELKNTRLDYLYSANYETWIDDAVRDYKDINAVLSKVANKKIVSHIKISDGIYETVYDGGTKVIVNYNSQTAAVDGLSVSGYGYIVLNEGR